MAKFTMIFLYAAGLFLFLIGFLGLIASFGNTDVSTAQALVLMVFAAVIMGLGAVLQILREIADNTSAERRIE